MSQPTVMPPAAAFADDAQRLAAAFADHVAAWAERAGAAPDAVAAARQAARAVSLSTSGGHVCTDLAEIAPDDPPAWRQRLLASGVVGPAGAPGSCPLVLDGEGRLYLHRYYDYERRLARRLRGFTSLPPRPIDGAARELLTTLFPRTGAEVDWQQVAAALALRQGLAIVSGGPGTGKTTTVVNLLACLLAQDPGCRIVLAAPTGKAAARMAEALRLRAGHLPDEVQARLPQEASTVHRLLGWDPRRARFRHDAAQPLLLDVLVVDEASMLDLALATRLLEAVPPGARVILLGDQDQLAAVESGAVFSELCADPTLGEACRGELEAACGIAPGVLQPPAPRRPTGLHDAVAWLQRNYRFGADSAIGRLAAAVNSGRADDALEALRSGAGVRWHPAEQGGGDQGAALAGEGFRPYLEAVLAQPQDPEAATGALGGFRVLCAVREGPRGVRAFNEALVRHAREVLAPVLARYQPDARSPWFPGRPVMVLANDYALKLFNGDIGIVLPDAQGELQVFFPRSDGGWRAIAPVRLPAHDTAFAMTVHKSQGSEFDRVLLVLPEAPSGVLTRELLYTGLTRARRQVDLLAGEPSVRAAVGRPTERHTGLLARLRERPEG